MLPILYGLSVREALVVRALKSWLHKAPSV